MNKKKTFCINFWAGIVGNILEHYDTAVFSLLAPFLAPLFFPEFEQITALLMTYAMLPLGSIAKPIGSLAFGYIGDRYGRKKALSYSLMGLAVITGLMGCLPTYQQIGPIAPVLMVIGRVLQNFFLGGEAAGGAVFILEHSNESKHSFLSSLYGSSTILGITLASSLITCLSLMGNMQDLWRAPFLIGFMTGLGGLFIRSKAHESIQFSKTQTHNFSIFGAIKNHWQPFLAIIAVAGFSSSNYIIALILPNGLLPKIASISQSEVMAINSMLLLADLAMLPLFGKIADMLTPRRSMLLAALSSVIVIPLYSLFYQASWIQIVVIRLILVALGVWFSAPLHAWIQSLVPIHFRYSIISLGYSLGSQLIGSPAATVSLLLFKKTGMVAAPGIYWCVTAGLAAFAIISQKKAIIPSSEAAELELAAEKI